MAGDHSAESGERSAECTPSTDLPSPHAPPASSPGFRFRITLPGLGFMILTASFGLHAVWAGNNLIFLLFTLLAGFGLGLVLLTVMMPFGVTIRRLLPEASYAGDEVHYRLEICNHWRWITVHFLWVQDTVTPGPQTSLACAVGPLRPGESVTMTQTVSASARGWLRFSGLRIRCRFPFELFESGRRHRLEQRLLVYPQRWEFRPGLAIAGLMEWTDYSRQVGRFTLDRSDFAGLREFYPGDHPRNIHWRASSRIPQLLLARQFEPHQDRQVAIILDSFYPRAAETRNRSALEDNICLALALSEMFLARQYEVIFAGFTAGPRLFHLHPASPSLAELRQWLALLNADHDHTLLHLISGLRLPPRAKCVLLLLPESEAAAYHNRLGACSRYTAEMLKPFVTLKSGARVSTSL